MNIGSKASNLADSKIVQLFELYEIVFENFLMT